nr:hypothetical protein ANI_1_1246164 [Aspergillus niger CBS 513.88]|eukprot:XP_001398768.2 hypothetical protein ANI_1_1246164 [Aspergillus niger CBS 513.88]
MAAAALDQLRSIFPDDSTDKVVINESADKYQAAVTCPWSQTCWTPAAAYVYLSTVQELTKALAIVQETGTKFAVRTTGHNPNAGFSSAGEAAVVLDIRQLRSKELLSDQGTARFGSGNTWGGMGALPNLYGLGADGVKNFEILLADGRLVNANRNENSDLYRALKGGGSNFGIVTRFDLETHPLIKVQYTINLYNPEDYVAINQATFEVQQTMEEDPRIGRAICTVTTRNSTALYDEVYKAWVEVRKTLPADTVLHYTIQPFGKAAVQAGKERGENIMGHESVPQCWWVFTCEWPKDGDDAAAQSAVDIMSEKVQYLAKDKGLLLDFKCMSFATASQRVLGSYGVDNIKRMQEVAAKYDPEGVFQKLQNGGFLLRDNV